MRTIVQRLEEIERLLAEQPCEGCSTTPFDFRIRTPADEERLQRAMERRRRLCTCGRPFHVRRTVIRLPEAA